MVYSEYCRDKLARSKIGGQSKPFVDGNLQFHLPEFDAENPQHLFSSHHPYTHYSNNSSYNKEAPTEQVNEKEIYQAMAQAEQSYQAWKKIQNLLSKIVKKQIKLD